jgi:hypothetical protein
MNRGYTDRDFDRRALREDRQSDHPQAVIRNPNGKVPVVARRRRSFDPLAGERSKILILRLGAFYEVTRDHATT